jgi:hypothetical protein
MSRALSTFLFAGPSAVSGAARMLDFWGLYDAYNVSRNGAEADAKALYCDWRTVGEYLMEAYEQIGPQESKRREQRVERAAAV